MFLVGLYFWKKNKNREDYYVGGRNIKPFHVGLSVVATDVGGGFSIGLGGLGFLIGLSGSWLLFTGLVGAWLSAVFIIPKIKLLDKKHAMLTFPDFLNYKFGKKVALAAAIISGIGYLGFTGGQVLAGAKLASATIFSELPFGIEPMLFSIIVIAFVILIYTSLGGIKAVIYTDTVQWIVLLAGLLFAAIPFTIIELGGISAIRDELPDGFFSLNNITGYQILDWSFTIIPIWLIGMTLYQRLYACKDEKDAKKAWYIAGFFEYPIMAFAGTFLGMCSRIFFPEADPESGLPLLLKEVLPIGLQGLVIAAYFSAIMSTADSCLLASSGNFVNDIIERAGKVELEGRKSMIITQGTTLLIGITAVLIAVTFESVLEIILHAYSFMVGALTVPTLAAYFLKNTYPKAAFVSLLAGGISTFSFAIFAISPFGLPASMVGILISFVAFFSVSQLEKSQNQ